MFGKCTRTEAHPKNIVAQYVIDMCYVIDVYYVIDNALTVAKQESHERFAFANAEKKFKIDK